MSAVSVPASGARARAWGGGAFDWGQVVLGIWFLGGLYVDGWAHNHGKVDQSFFTPWHALFYSGFAAVAAGLILAVARNRALGLSWRRAVPQGYQASLVGVLIFALGGVGDLVWHTLFGIETDIEALYSPSHLTLAVGMFLVLTGPWRAGWQRSGRTQGWAALAPVVLSATFTLALLAFLTQGAHPLVQPLAAGRSLPTSAAFTRASLGIASVLLQAALTMGIVLLMLRRWTLPFGALALMFTANAVLLSALQDQARFILPSLLAGLAADVLLHWLRPSAARVLQLRLFAFASPALFYAAYFAALWLTDGIWWRVHMWGGAIALAGVVGVLLSLLVAPPPLPTGMDTGETS